MATITRRNALTGAGALGLSALAGCLQFGTSTETALEYTLRTDRIDNLVGRAIWLPPETASPLRTVRREAWQAVTAGERYTAYGYKPLQEKYTEREGTFYHIDTLVTGRKEIQRPILRLAWTGRVDELDPVPAYVHRDDLPGIDRGAVMSAYFAARSRENGGEAPQRLIEKGGHVYRLLDRAESELAPEPEHTHVRVHDTILKVSVSEARLVEPAYTSQATAVANSRNEFAEIADATLVDARASSESLSSDTVQIFRRSEGGDGYTEQTPLSESFRELIRALELRAFLWGSPSERQLRGTNQNVLEYDEEYYTFDLFISEAD